MVFLCCLLLVIIAVNFGIDFTQKQPVTDFTSVQKALAEWEENQKNQLHPPAGKLYPFNPNTITEEEIDSLAIPPNVKNNLIKYRRSGGWFYNSESVRKIYGMNDSLFALLRDYMVFTRNQSGLETAEETTPANRLSVHDFFDPNTVPERKLTEWGLTDYQITNLVKYRESGGVFRKPDDLKRIYGLDSTRFNALKPWVRIGVKEQNPESRAERANPVCIELNRADSAALVKLYGIGPVFSSRIIRYRRLLGGFARKEQLLEVYNLKPGIYARIKGSVYVDTSRITKISLNFSDYQDLVRHPYIHREQAKKIINARNKSGPFETCEELFSKNIVNEDIFRKIKPYLKVN